MIAGQKPAPSLEKLRSFLYTQLPSRGPHGRLEPVHGAWCADVLLRSGAFALVVLDGAPMLARGVAVRLTRLAREADAAFLVLGDDALGPRPESKFSETGEVHTRFQRTTLMHPPNALSLFLSR
jgi:hypothetical protein